MQLSKSHITDIVTTTLIIISFFIPNQYGEVVLYIGLFAISGAVTNQLAIYAL